MEGVRETRTLPAMASAARRNDGPGPAARTLRALRVRAKLSIAEAAEAAGKEKSSYQYYEDEFKKRLLPVELVMALAPLFEVRGVPKEELYALAGIKSSDDASQSEEPLLPLGEDVRQIPFGDGRLAPREWPRDLPVQGSAACGEDGLFEFNGEVVEFIRRPPRLIGAKNAYAIYIANDSMSPWREHGETVYVHPDLPVRVGDYVVVQMNPKTRAQGELPAAYVKKLVARNSETVRLEQYKPADVFALKTRDIKSIHRIVSWSEALGI